MIRLFSLDRRGINPARFDGGNSWLGTHVLGQTICNGLCRTGSKWSGIFLDLIRKFDFLNWSLPNDKGVHIEHRHAFYIHTHTHTVIVFPYLIAPLDSTNCTICRPSLIEGWTFLQLLMYESDTENEFVVMTIFPKRHSATIDILQGLSHTHAFITFVVEISGNFWSCFTKICSDIFH